MAVQSLNVIALPAGAVGEKELRVSLVISPRLTEGTTLGEFPDFTDLTAELAESAPTLTLRCGANSVPAVVNLAPLRADLWTKIFQRDNPVAPFAFDDYRGNLVISYRTRNALAVLKNSYQIVTTASPGSLPFNRTLSALLSGYSIGTDNQPLDHVVRRLRLALFAQQQGTAGISSFGGGTVVRPLDPDGTSVEPIDSTVVRATAAEFLLYQRMPPAPHRPPLPSTPQDFAKLVDVHRAFTAIASYP